MSRTVVLGAGIAGHTAALHLRRMLGRDHEVVVVSPNSQWNWIPSNIWVGVGQMSVKQVTFLLAPVYWRKGIEFHQAFATELHGAGGATSDHPYVSVRSTDPARAGEIAELEYNYLINATGPKLNFGATPGLGPDGYTWSVCTAGHATEAAKSFDAVVQKLKAGEHQTLLIGMGHGTCTGQAAAMTVFPIIPDKAKYGEAGRDTKQTYGEIGLSAHWMKVMLHYLFIYKAKARPLWHLIPE